MAEETREKQTEEGHLQTRLTGNARFISVAFTASVGVIVTSIGGRTECAPEAPTILFCQEVAGRKAFEHEVSPTSEFGKPKATLLGALPQDLIADEGAGAQLVSVEAIQVRSGGSPGGPSPDVRLAALYTVRQRFLPPRKPVIQRANESPTVERWSKWRDRPNGGRQENVAGA